MIGCILLDPSLVGHCVEKIRNTEAFYDLRHRTIYELLVSMYDAREPIDMLTVQEGLKNLKKLEAVGGLAYVSSLPDTVPSAANLDYYLDILLEKYALRLVIRGSTNAIAEVYESTGTFAETMDRAGKHLAAAVQDCASGEERSAKDLVQCSIDLIEKLHRNQGKPSGLSTGFGDLDKLTSGLHPGEMAVIAASSSEGKTALALNIAEHVVLDLGLPVGIFSLEMTGEALMTRMLCSRARVNLRNVNEGMLVERDFPKLISVSGKLAKAPLHIDDSSGLTILQIKAKARRMHQKHGIKLLIVDYLQLVVGGGRFENRQVEVTGISRGIRELAKELKIPVIAICQLNREFEKDKKRKPRLADLRESGAIGQDADFVGMLYRPEAKEGEPESDTPRVNLWIEKQRNGPRHRDVELLFNLSYTRFESVCKIDPADLPYIPTSSDDKRD